MFVIILILVLSQKLFLWKSCFEAKLPSAELENDKLYNIIVEKSFISSVKYIKKASTFDIIVCFNKIT